MSKCMQYLDRCNYDNGVDGALIHGMWFSPDRILKRIFSDVYIIYSFTPLLVKQSWPRYANSGRT